MIGAEPGTGFQSLFWWISLLGSGIFLEMPHGTEFQSLFWWISLLGEDRL